MGDHKPEIKTITVKELREEGYIQEANRLFFHPLGLALSVSVEEDGTESFGTVWDHRDDPEGITFGGAYVESPDWLRKARNVAQARLKHFPTRASMFGSDTAHRRGALHEYHALDIQPLDPS
jgi:hypothetical protein